ncbi:MAG: flagellar protein FlgN [Deltaproteobacteria bacterium]|nr:flagellar protein FlgN [Deltaproteobacteria bacterium]
MPHKLVNILEQEMVLYIELISLLQEEKRLLSKRATDELHQLAARIEGVAFKIKGMDGARSRVAGELAARYGLAGSLPASLSLSMVIGRVEEPWKGRLNELRSRLLSLVGAIRELNRENSIVIGRGMENIKTAFLFLKELSTFETYQPSGMASRSLSKGV